MNTSDVLDRLSRDRLVIIARGIETQALLDATVALRDAGITLLETTFDHRLADPIGDAKSKIRALSKAFPEELILGAGTALTVEEVQAACDAGCAFILSPNTNEAVITETKRLGMVSIPGAMTPTEICRAWELGADMVKVFPADDLGLHYFENLRGPLPHIPLMATGGVNPVTIPQLLARGVRAVATGVTVLRQDLLAKGDYEGIATLARMHVDAVRLAAGEVSA